MHPFQKPSLGIYIHWPYCLSKCPYCDFASSVHTQIDEELLFKGFLRDIKYFYTYEKSQHIVSSVFFGGGTPSIMSPQLTDRILNELHKYFSFHTLPEISLEANPDAITLSKMKAFYQTGVNRLSIGVQALNEKDLLFLGRRHTVSTALKRIQEASNVFEKVNIDLIYARPGQTLKKWEDELKQALKLNLTHYSFYQLSIEEGTPFFNQEIALPSDKQASRLYILTENMMTQAGIEPYEISNYAKPGYECRHNLTYWRGEDYIGIGPAAHGRLGRLAIENDKNVSQWLKKGPHITELSVSEKKLEKLLMGIRLIQEGFPLQELNLKNVQIALHKKWAILTGNHLFTTQKGRLMLNQLILLLNQDPKK